MKTKIALLIFGIVLVMAGFSIPSMESQMWWNQPVKIEHGVGIMKEITPSDQFFMSLYKIWPFITLAGLGIIFVDVTVFFIYKRKK